MVWNINAGDFQLILPEVILCLTGLLLLVLEMLAPRETGLIGGTAIAGLVASLLAIGRLGFGASFDPARVEPSSLAFFGAMAADGFGGLFKVVAILGALLVVLMSFGYAHRFRNSGEFFALLLFATLAAVLLCSAADLLMIYLSLEFLSITSYVLTGYLKFQPRSTEAGIKYFLYGAVSAAVMLYGMSLIYGLTGTTSLYGGVDASSAGLAAALADPRLHSGANGNLLMLATALVMVGFGFKTAMVPFHQWVPDVYEGSPTPVTAWLSVTSKAAGLAVFVRFFTAAVPNQSWASALALLSALTMTVGNLVAIPQTNIKRMLAYSSIAHAGYALIGLASYRLADGSVNPWAVQGILLYLLTYLFMNLGAFAVLIVFYERERSHVIEEYAGLAQSSPATALMMTLFLLSLAGLPPTAGFVGKLFLFGAAVKAGQTWLAVVGVINAVISVYYYWNVVRCMYILPTRQATALRLSGGVAAALGLATAGTLALFLFAQPVLRLLAGGEADAGIRPHPQPLSQSWERGVSRLRELPLSQDWARGSGGEGGVAAAYKGGASGFPLRRGGISRR
jgi:proton-translocating NADH-quinone oxidoreductase chain N